MLIKRKFICPGCGQEHTVAVDVPVRRRNRTTYRPVYRGSRMEYAIAEVDEGFEYALPWKQINDLLFYPVGAAIGMLGGAIVYIITDTWLGPLNPNLLLSLCSAGVVGMLVYVHWVLMDMSKQERIKAKLLSYWQVHSIPQSETNVGPVVLEVSHRERDGAGEAGRTIQYFGELPVEVGIFNEYAKSILAGKTLAIAQWVGGGKPFSRQQYEDVLNILKQGGLVLTYPGTGNKLTRKGYRTLEGYLSQIDQATPLPRHLERA